MVAEAVGYDAAKQIKGATPVVDTLGLVLRVFVSAAVWVKGAKRPQARQTHGQSRLTSPHRLGRWGYDGTPFLIWVMDVSRLSVVLRPEQTKGFVLLKSVGSSSVRLADGVAPIG